MRIFPDAEGCAVVFRREVAMAGNHKTLGVSLMAGMSIVFFYFSFWVLVSLHTQQQLWHAYTNTHTVRSFLCLSGFTPFVTNKKLQTLSTLIGRFFRSWMAITRSRRTSQTAGSHWPFPSQSLCVLVIFSFSALSSLIPCLLPRCLLPFPPKSELWALPRDAFRQATAATLLPARC